MKDPLLTAAPAHRSNSATAVCFLLSFSVTLLLLSSIPINVSVYAAPARALLQRPVGLGSHAGRHHTTIGASSEGAHQDISQFQQSQDSAVSSWSSSLGRRLALFIPTVFSQIGGLTALAVDTRQLMQRGSSLFASADIVGAVEAFDAAGAADARLRPYLWQRGIALYYADRFKDCAAQFRFDVAANPNDTEEAVWAMLCEARDPDIGFENARQQMLKVGYDFRPYMRAADAVFRGEASEKALQASGTDRRAAFYRDLYLGLYAEAKGDMMSAQNYITSAVKSPYASSGDYMYTVALVHQRVRGW